MLGSLSKQTVLNYRTYDKNITLNSYEVIGGFYSQFNSKRSEGELDRKLSPMGMKLWLICYLHVP